jgi:tetratricopeptide (TPR) repeat protein
MRRGADSQQRPVGKQSQQRSGSPPRPRRPAAPRTIKVKFEKPPKSLEERAEKILWPGAVSAGRRNAAPAGRDWRKERSENRASLVPEGPRRWHEDHPEESELPLDVREELAQVTPPGSPRRSGKAPAERLAAAAAAYERDRYGDTLRMTKALLSIAPGSAAARELHGLACYRLGKWEEAIRHLELVVSSGDDQSQIPVIMDCNRALGRSSQVEKLWFELKRSSPDADVLVEGRLVLASTRAHRGDPEGAIELLMAAGAAKALRHPAERHVRQWYLLGDLLEKTGDIPRAREMFERVVRADPDLADAEARLASLGRNKPKSGRRGISQTAARQTPAKRIPAKQTAIKQTAIKQTAIKQNARTGGPAGERRGRFEGR